MMKSFWMILTALVAVLAMGGDARAQLYFRVDNVSAPLTSNSWGTSSNGPFTGAWANNSNVIFSSNSTITYVSTTPVGNFSIINASTVNWTSAGTYSTGGVVRTFDFDTGSIMTWVNQNVSTVSGTGFIKNGNGTWDVGVQANSYNGGFTLNAGTVIVAGNNSLGGSTSALTLNGGILQSTGGRTYANNITIGGDFGNAGTGNATFSGTVALGSATRSINNTTTSGSRIYSGVISSTGTSGLTFTGAGAGQTYIGNAGNTFIGTVTIAGSEVGFANNGSLGNVNNTIVIDGGRFTASTTAGAAATYTLDATHAIQVGSTTGTAISVVSGGVLTYDGTIGDKSGSIGAWAKQGSGTLALGGASTYTGATAINNGTLRLTTANDRLPTGTTVSLGQAASTNLGTLDLNGFNQTLAGLNSTAGTNVTTTNNTVTSTAPATLTLGGSGSYSFGDGTNANSGVIAGGISIVKNGTGTQTFGDVNTYTGTTNVNAGSLLATNSSGSATGTGNVNVNSVGLLGGTGTVGGAVTVASGGTVRGDSLAGVGTLSLGSNLTIASDASNGGKIQSTVTGAPGVGNSKLTFTSGTLTLGDATGKFTIDLRQGAVAVTEFQQYTIVLATATGGGLFKVGNTTLGANSVVSTDRYTVSNNFQYGITGDYVLAVDNTGNNLQLTFSPVPEPGSMVALGAAGLGLLGAFRRYRNRKGAVGLAT